MESRCLKKPRLRLGEMQATIALDPRSAIRIPKCLLFKV